MADSVNVYIGTWLNHSNNVLTLTLRDKEAAILAAALVIFVGFVANHAWNILKFVLHQLRTTRVAENELHQQQQIVLRNSANHVHAFLLMTRLAFGWGITKRRVSRMAAFEGSIFLMILTLLGSLGWAAVQVSLAVVWTAAGDQFLVVPSHCGWIPRYNNVSTPEAQTYYDVIKGGMDMANTYQLQCYRQRNESSSDNKRCGSFPVPHIDWVGTDADCPFGNKNLCVATNSTPFRMDTGYINSQTHLGINTGYQDSIDYRYIATCSPLVPDYRVSKNGSLYYYYGNNTDIQEDFPGERATWVQNITGRTDDNHYNVWAFSYVVDKEFRNLIRDWRPNATMIPKDKSAFTMSIFFITAGQMFYVSENYDPIFSTKPKPGRVINNVPAYTPENPMSILGCIEEQEICNPSAPEPNKCMLLSRNAENVTVFSRLNLNPVQSATTLILRNELEKNLFRNYVNYLTPQLLASTSLVRGTRSYFQYLDFPRDHWRVEVSRWFDVNLIMLQHAFVDYVVGPDDPEAIALVAGPEDNTNTTEEIRAELDRGCQRQIVRNVNGVRNFNFRAILFVIGPGFAIMVLGFTIDSLAAWAQGLLRKGEARRALWVRDDMLQPKREGEGDDGYERVLLGGVSGGGGGWAAGEGTEYLGGYTGYSNGRQQQDQVKVPLVAASPVGGGYKSPGLGYSPG
ncbi:hypothetical protein QBC34DRAFT_375364 [Podospora aff. communis PSN243]|uniref:Uncharacterized protein n=1 Tax=Podospora aff. communis PSN243 TaxID=3040156 RepID=A0AAV9H5B1_9PEZI|nr:hypothetical protein QBC34DRAFT_375364 [Podospora aff. communis PSN243]